MMLLASELGKKTDTIRLQVMYKTGQLDESARDSQDDDKTRQTHNLYKNNPCHVSKPSQVFFWYRGVLGLE